MDIPQAAVHRCPDGIRDLHRQFGLWICLWKCGLGTALTYRETRPRKFEYYSLSSLIRGSARLWEEESGRERDILPGELVLLPPNRINRFGSTGEFFLEDAVCFCGAAADALFENGMIRCGVFSSAEERPLRRIISIARNPAPQKQLEANIRLLQLLLELHPAEEAPSHRPPVDRRMHELLNRFSRDPNEFRSVDEMAAGYGCGIDQFRILFRRCTGMLPKDYLDQIKITRARELLLGSTLSVAEIAGRLGFHDQFHFSRVFKKKTGTPPSDFRRRFGGDAPTTIHSAEPAGKDL